ncbi:hypothetical protein LZZ50_02785 [Xanthomonas arboricola]|uniref:hypothetical protein n=1 Tax=Xanthomonas arboricola TaxID=56448 RepID=UPI001FD6F1DD|nr:hypothetical protein [Xanthomonas arboricola]UOS99320.1 hypothetical protein LZZ50_02785 [Xanthomonas arboricola]
MLYDTEIFDSNGVRLGNTISLLIPAYSYHINCAWTQEVPLPAIEEFTCRLLIVLQEMLPGEIQEYFGLSKREREVLIETLLKNKLAFYTNEGLLAPSSILMDRTKGDPDIPPRLTKYEERTETVVFEALTISIMPSTSYNRSRFGLRQLAIPAENQSPLPEVVTEEFGRQYRAFLDHSRRQEHEIKNTRLYKVSGCSTGRFLQIPIDLEIWLRPTKEGDVEVLKKVSERASGSRQRPLSMEVEAKISDYLNGVKMPSKGINIARYCKLFDDHVLNKYIDERGLDLNRWLIDHSSRKTGYGSSATRSLIGPIFCLNNKITLERMLDDLSAEWRPAEVHRGFWLSSSAPFWGGNGHLLNEFCNEVAKHLTEDRKGRGIIAAIMPFESKEDLVNLKQSFHTRLPNAIAYEGVDLQTQVEIFLVPGQLAVVQYHVQPDVESAITVPIGYVTIEKIRITKIENYLDNLIKNRGKPVMAWTDAGLTVDEILGDCRTKFCEANRKPILSLNKST